MQRKQLAFPMIKEICDELHIKFLQEPLGMYGVLIFQNGKKFYLKDMNLNINTVSSMRITKDKDLTSYFLKKFGYNVPDYKVVYSDNFINKYNLKGNIQSGLSFARKIGYPVILKINDLSEGRGIYKAYNEEEVVKYANIIFNENYFFQIQKFYDYNDFRIVVLKDKVISAYQRIPLFIVGDGLNSIERLIQNKQRQFKKELRDTIINIDDDLITNLTRLGYNLKTILPNGEKCTLRNVSNLSAGGECVDVTDKIHQDYIDLCVNIVKDLNLNLGGIDIMCNDITKSLDPNYIVLEVNSAPGLNNYAYIGRKQVEYTKNIYRQLILFLKELMEDDY